jgi:hypothetical protein
MNPTSRSLTPEVPASGAHAATEPLPAWQAPLNTQALDTGGPNDEAPNNEARGDAFYDAEEHQTGVIPLPPASDEPFVPKARYSMGRSTKILVCVALVMAGGLGGAAVQKGMDAGNRGTRANFSNVQNAGSGAANTAGQGRRRGAQTGATGAPTGGESAQPKTGG